MNLFEFVAWDPVKVEPPISLEILVDVDLLDAIIRSEFISAEFRASEFKP
jgi:hypothetical protein